MPSVLMHYFFGLAVVGALLFGLQAILRTHGMRRFGTDAPSIRVVQSAMLSPQTGLYVVETSGRRYLVGGGAGRVNLVAELPSVAEAAFGDLRSS